MIRRLALSFCLLASACSGGAGPASDPTSGPITLAIVNARVWTGDQAMPWAEAIAVRGEHIAAVGTSADIRQQAGEVTPIDAGGRLVVPGFNDAHIHLVSGALSLERVDLIEDETVEAIRASAGHVQVHFSHEGKPDAYVDLFTGWMLLSYRKPVRATSVRDTFPAANLTDEDPRTYWLAAANRAGEGFTVDLGGERTIRALQLAFVDHESDIFLNDSTVYTRFRVVASPDGRRWTTIADLSEETRDRANPYIELPEPVRARYVRYEHLRSATPNLAISDIRVFGTGDGPPPPTPAGLVVRRDTDPRNAFIAWQPVAGAVGYNVLWGIAPEKLRFHEHGPDELAHYAKKAFDIEYELPFGWHEFEGIHNRTDFDLGRHQEHSGKRLEYIDPVDRDKRYIPYIIETSAGADRTALVVLADAYREEDVEGEQRVVLGLHPKLAPIKAAIFPLVKKDGLPEIAERIHKEFREAAINSFYDDAGSIGKRYRRQDEAGTPFCLTVDGQTSEDGTVTVRDRDTLQQERVAADRVVAYVTERVR